MTEIIWEGKYKDGKKVAPVTIALPFQTVESVNESTQQRQTMLDLFSAGKVNLIYIDPPFDTGADFSFTATIPDNPETEENEETQFIKQPNIIEQKAYRDTWGRGLDSYLQWFYETTLLLRELLSDEGSIYVHIGPNISHYVKGVLDEIFSYQAYKNEIIWLRTAAHSGANKYGIVSDSIYFFTKSDKFTFNTPYKKHDESYIKSHYSQVDIEGRRYQLVDLSGAGSGPARKFGKDIIEPPKGRHWAYDQDGIDRLLKENKIVFTDNGRPRLKKYFDESKGAVVQSVWGDIYPVNSQAKERVDYPTQKPEALLDRIIKASSHENDLILDCFCGSGTTAAVAEKLNRRWITCDLGRFAIHTTRKRLLQIPNVKPFIVQNLGKYERQQWVSAEFTNAEDRLAQEKAYRNFIIELYHAQPIQGYVYLHGAKAGRMVHVGAVDAPVCMGDIKSIIQEFWKTVGKDKEITRNGIDVLGWDFAFELNETALQFAASNKIDLKFKKIPREVLEKKAVEQGDIRFFEMASLNVKVKKAKTGVNISLENFIVPPDDVPQEVQSNITHWSQWIDYWAIDWDYKNDTFHNQWQSYRSRQNSNIDLSTSHTYEKAGKYFILVKVIDILGNDTTKLLTVEI